jgi:hypothetical protein
MSCFPNSYAICLFCDNSSLSFVFPTVDVESTVQKHIYFNYHSPSSEPYRVHDTVRPRSSQHTEYARLITTTLVYKIHLFAANFLSFFLKAFNLQGKGAVRSAANWFQFMMVLFTNEYLPISVLRFLLLILWSSSSLLWALRVCPQYNQIQL